MILRRRKTCAVFFKKKNIKYSISKRFGSFIQGMYCPRDQKSLMKRSGTHCSGIHCPIQYYQVQSNADKKLLPQIILQHALQLSRDNILSETAENHQLSGCSSLQLASQSWNWAYWSRHLIHTSLKTFQFALKTPFAPVSYNASQFKKVSFI